MKNKYTVVVRNCRKVRIARKNAELNTKAQHGVCFMPGRTWPMQADIKRYNFSVAENRRDRASFLQACLPERISMPENRRLP